MTVATRELHMFAGVLSLVVATFGTATSPSFARCEIGTTETTTAPPDSVVAVRLIADAEVIVRVRAVEADRTASSGNAVRPVGVRFERLEILKATDSIPRFVTVNPAVLTDLDEFNPQPVPYAIVRPSGRRGTCYATTYRRGAEYLLFMSRQLDWTLTPYWAPLMPTNEELRGPADAWLLWVRARRH